MAGDAITSSRRKAVISARRKPVITADRKPPACLRQRIPHAAGYLAVYDTSGQFIDALTDPRFTLGPMVRMTASRTLRQRQYFG